MQSSSSMVRNVYLVFHYCNSYVELSRRKDLYQSPFWYSFSCVIMCSIHHYTGKIISNRNCYKWLWSLWDDATTYLWKGIILRDTAFWSHSHHGHPCKPLIMPCKPLIVPCKPLIVLYAKFGHFSGKKDKGYKSTYSRTSAARTPLGPWKLVRDRGSSSQWGLIIAPDQKA